MVTKLLHNQYKPTRRKLKMRRYLPLLSVITALCLSTYPGKARLETATASYQRFPLFFNTALILSQVTSPSATLRTYFYTSFGSWPSEVSIRNNSYALSGAILYANGNIEVTDPFGDTRTIAQINSDGELVDIDATNEPTTHVDIGNHQAICVLANHNCL